MADFPERPDWEALEFMDILRYGVADSTWRWQDRRNMRLVSRRWREAVLLPRLFLAALDEKEDLKTAVNRTSCLVVGSNSSIRFRQELPSVLEHNRTINRLYLYKAEPGYGKVVLPEEQHAQHFGARGWGRDRKFEWTCADRNIRCLER